MHINIAAFRIMNPPRATLKGSYGSMIQCFHHSTKARNFRRSSQFTKSPSMFVLPLNRTFEKAFSKPAKTMAAQSESQHIVVVGGGIIGACSAYYLASHPSFDKARDSITLLEATAIAGGASGKAGGLLAKWAYPECIVPLSFRLHEELAKEHDGAKAWGYRRVQAAQVVAVLGDDAAKHAGAEDGMGEEGGIASYMQKRSAKADAKLEAAGVPKDLDWLDGEALVRYERMSSADDTAQVHPELFTKRMAELAAARGVKVVLGKATEIRHAEGLVQSVAYRDSSGGSGTTTKRALPATKIVLAAGPWSGRLLSGLPVDGMRAHSTVIRTPREVSPYCLFTELSVPAKGKKRGHDSVSPEIYARPDGTIYACGAVDHKALPESTALVEVDEQRAQDVIDQVTALSDELKAGEVLVRQACYLPEVTSANKKKGRGPIVGEAKIKGLVIATGHTCWGIQNSAGTGKVVSEIVWDGKATSADISELSPQLWGL
jgi:glycine/D-amino acid oxidase-like deaminating enzyme